MDSNFQKDTSTETETHKKNAKNDLWQMELSEFLDVSTKLFSSNNSRKHNHEDVVFKKQSLSDNKLSDITGSAVLRCLSNINYLHNNMIEQDDDFLQKNTFQMKYDLPQKLTENLLNVPDDMLNRTVDWCGHTKPPMSAVRSKYCPLKEKQKKKVTKQVVRPKSAAISSKYPQSSPSIATEYQNISSKAVAEDVKVKPLGGKASDAEKRFWDYYHHKRSYPLRKGVTKSAVNSTRQLGYINLLEPALELGIFDLVRKNNTQQNTRVSTASKINRKIVTPRSEHTANIKRQTQANAQQQKIVYMNMDSTSLVPPATPSSRPQTATNFHRPLKSSVQRSVSSLAVTPKTKVPIQRSVPSIPYNSGTPSERQRPFAAQLEFYARTLENPKQYFDKVHKLRTSRPSSTLSTPRNDREKLQHSSSNMDEIMELRGVKSALGMANEKQAGTLSHRQEKSMRESRPISAKCFSRQNSGRASKSSRPIPCAHKVEDPDEELEKLLRWKEAVEDVNIESIFGHRYLSPDHAKKIDPVYIERILKEKEAALTIQRNYRKHLARKAKIESRPLTKLNWNTNLVQNQTSEEEERQRKRYEASEKLREQNEAFYEKVSKIGPHVDIYQHFLPVHEGLNARERHLAAIMLQKTTRGWFTRQQMKLLESKARLLGYSSLKGFLPSYYRLLKRIMHLNNVRNPVINFDFREVLEFMNIKRRCDLAFESVAHNGHVRDDDLMDLLHSCGFYPARYEIQDVLDSEFSHRDDYTLSKEQVSTLLFHIFKPKATGLSGQRPSTWMHPIINGVDAESVVRPEEVGPVPLTSCIKLVLSSRLPDLPLDKQVEVRRHLRELERMEALKASREAKAKALAAQKAKNPIQQEPELQVSPKIRWIRD